MRALEDPDKLRAQGRHLLNERLGLSAEPVLIQAAAFHGWPEERVARVIEQLKPFPVVTLALGAYAGEDRQLGAAARATGVPALSGLNSEEVTAVLAAAGCIFTTSLHAAIVASCVGTPTLVPNVEKTASTLAICPEEPRLLLTDEADVARAVADVYGEAVPLPNGLNAQAARDAFGQTMEFLGFKG
jgi:hypothetical protein